MPINNKSKKTLKPIMPLKCLLYGCVLRFDKNTVLDAEFQRSDGRTFQCRVVSQGTDLQKHLTYNNLRYDNRDVNFREFYFSIRECKISRLVEYSTVNFVLGDGP